MPLRQKAGTAGPEIVYNDMRDAPLTAFRKQCCYGVASGALDSGETHAAAVQGLC